jgi:adenosine deaminase
MLNYTKNTFLKLPKADVHSHFHLGGSQKKLFEKYPNSKIKFPEKYDGLTGMIDFIYGHLNLIMVTSEDVICFMKNAIESSIADNVTLLEASVDVGLARFFDNSIDTLISEVYRIKEKYKSQIDFKPDIGINKDLPIDKVYMYGDSCIKSGVFNGIDIYGKEANQNLNSFKDLFEIAKKTKLKTKAHIGEFSDYKSIEETINLLNPDELQHGINAVNSEKTMDLILERNIRLNTCLHSNISLGAVSNLKTHPIRKLFDKGIKVTVNTDDLILFDATVTDELFTLYSNNIFSFDELETIRKNAFN